jgi:hypothetical protein
LSFRNFWCNIFSKTKKERKKERKERNKKNKEKRSLNNRSSSVKWSCDIFPWPNAPDPLPTSPFIWINLDKQTKKILSPKEIWKSKELVNKTTGFICARS